MTVPIGHPRSARENLIAYCVYTDPNYNPQWFHKTKADYLEKVLNGEIKRLMIFEPPRHGKTEIVSRKFPTFAMGKKSGLKVIVVGYSTDFVERECGAKAKAIIENKYEDKNGNIIEPYYALFNTRLKKNSQAKGDWELDNGSSYYSVGAGGATTGMGANLLIIDDPFKNSEEAESQTIREARWDWYRTTLLTRLEKDAAIIIINTRWHLDDLSGKILAIAEKTKEDWTVLSFPAISENGFELHTSDPRAVGSNEALWADKYSINDLNIIKNTLGIYMFYALYQQTPVATENQVFKSDTFKYITREELEHKKTFNYLTIDTDSFDIDTDCAIGICENYVDIQGFWHIACYGKKLNPGEFINWLFYIQEKRNFKLIGIEKMMASKVLKFFLDNQMRERSTFLPIHMLEPKGVNKNIRIKAGLEPIYSSKSIFHIKDECKEYELELLTFPKSKTRDRMDAAAYQIQIAQKPYNTESENNNIQIVNPYDEYMCHSY